MPPSPSPQGTRVFLPPLRIDDSPADCVRVENGGGCLVHLGPKPDTGGIRSAIDAKRGESSMASEDRDTDSSDLKASLPWTATGGVMGSTRFIRVENLTLSGVSTKPSRKGRGP